MPRTCPPNHPFVRLPTLQPGVNPMPIDMQRAFSYKKTSSRPLAAMRLAHDMLAKESLCQRDADLLLWAAEVLIAHCQQHQTTPLSRRNVHQAADALALRFVILDMIVSAMQVLQQNGAPAGWESFVSSIPHDMSQCPQGKQGTHLRWSHRGHVARALSRAVGTLKSLKRPANNVLYGLKYILFCSREYPLRFARSAYDPWRKHCPDKR